MKKALFFAITIMITSSIFGQNFRLRFHADPTLSWARSSDGDIANAQAGMGVNYGIEADMFIKGNERYCLNTGILVSTQSFSMLYGENVNNFELMGETVVPPIAFDYTLNNIQIPFDIKLRSDQFNRLAFYGQFGLSTYFNINASVNTSNDSFNLNGDKLTTVANVFNAAMLMGGGFEYDLGGNTALVLGFQYQNGLTDITEIKGLEDEKTTVSSVKFVIGLMF